MTRLLAAGPSRAAVQAPRHAPLTPASTRLRYSTVIYQSRAVSKEFKFDASQVYGSEVKVNPSESEADVAADRSEIDPLPQGMHRTICLDAGEVKVYMQPTDSEAAVHADRDGEDPLKRTGGGGG